MDRVLGSTGYLIFLLIRYFQRSQVKTRVKNFRCFFNFRSIPARFFFQVQFIYFWDHSRGGFRISSRGWQRYPQGVTKICPGGGEKIARYPPLPKRFLVSYTTLLIYAHFLDILDTCYKEIHKIYFKKKFVPVLSQVQEGLKPPEMVRGWRRHPLKPSGGGERGRATPLKSPLDHSLNCLSFS